jgi:hypothetical protein
MRTGKPVFQISGWSAGRPGSDRPHAAQSPDEAVRLALAAVREAAHSD